MEGEIQKERWVKGKEGITSLKAAMSAGNKITTYIFMVVDHPSPVMGGSRVRRLHCRCACAY